MRQDHSDGGVALRPRWWALLFAVSVLVPGCGAASRGVIEHPFPERAELVEIAKVPPKSTEKALKDAPLAVDEWQFQAVAPEEPGSKPYAGDDGMAPILKKAVGERGVTHSMQCFAMEMGKFLATHGRKPQIDLQGFMAGRCGLIPAEPQFLFWQAEKEPSEEEAKRLIEEAASKLPRGVEAGAWVGGGAAGGTIFLVWGKPKARLDSAISVDGDRVRVRGRLLEPTGWMQAHVTSGEVSVKRCTPAKGSASLPAFDLSCPVDTADPFTVIELLAGAPSAVLGRSALLLLVPLTDTALPKYSSPAPGGKSQALEATLLQAINALRARESQPELEEVKAQSKTARALLPHFFSAAVESDTVLTDKIALGMMAGWDVKGPIRDAGFASFYGYQGKNAHSFVSELLFFPTHRALLLDGGARRIALALETDKKAEAAYGMLTTYSLFEARDESETEVAILDELDRQRQAAGKGPVERVSDTEAVMTPVMKKLEQGKTDPVSGLEEVLNAYAKSTQQNFQGTLYATTVIDGFHPEFSGPLLELDHVAVTARVGFYVGDGSNWGQYVVYVVFMPMPDAMANAPSGRGGH